MVPNSIWESSVSTRKQRSLANDLERLAAVAGATAAVAQTVATASDRAHDVAEIATEQVAKVTESAPRRRGLIIVAVLALVGLVALILWRRSSSGSAQLSVVDAGPGAPVDIAVTTSA